MLRYNLEVLSEKITECKSCSLRTIDCPVPGYGDKSDVMILLEYPDKDEALLGRPLENRTGILLKKIMAEEEIDYKKCYITHTLKCNASSAGKITHNINICKKWLWEEIQTVQPKLILAFGKIPSQLLLKGKSTFKLKDVLGKSYVLDYLNGITVIPWYNILMFNNMNSLVFKTRQFFKEIKKAHNV